MQWSSFFASDLVFIPECFFCPIGCHAGVFSEEKISQFWVLMQLKKKKFIVLSKASIKNMGPKCIFLDTSFCLAAEELKPSFL